MFFAYAIIEKNTKKVIQFPIWVGTITREEMVEQLNLPDTQELVDVHESMQPKPTSVLQYYAMDETDLVYENETYYQKWNLKDYDHQESIDYIKFSVGETARQERLEKLKVSDILVIRQLEDTGTVSDILKQYRQELRDFNKKPNFPATVIMPSLSADGTTIEYETRVNWPE